MINLENFDATSYFHFVPNYFLQTRSSQMKFFKILIATVLLLNSLAYAAPTENAAIQDIQAMVQNFDAAKNALQFSDQYKNKIEVLAALRKLVAGEPVFISSKTPNPNRLRLSKVESDSTSPLGSLRIEQLIGDLPAATTVLKFELTSDLARTLYQKIFGDSTASAQIALPLTPQEKLARDPTIYQSENVRVVCESRTNYSTGQVSREVTLGIGPDNIGTLAVLALPALALFLMHPGRGGRGVGGVFAIAGILAVGSIFLYGVGSQTGCN
jgi:hypothetical protein